MIPKKLFWMLGYNNLSLILDQERKHWLMKTDKKKQIQDKLTGDMFQGQIDNIGSDIIIESEKLPYKYDFIPEISFATTGIQYILGISNSAFPHSAMVNGLMFTRILSTNYPHAVDGELQYNHYKIKFTDAKTCIIPFGGSSNSSEVYADKWIYTANPPIIMIMDNAGRYSITKEIRFSDSVTNAVYYYPLTDTLQPLGITDLGHGVYELDAVNDDGMIGYPLYWFTCDQTNVGSNISFENNMNSRNEQIFFVSNEGNATKYDAKIYTGLDGNNDATPDGTGTEKYTIECSCKSGNSFSNTDLDFSKPIDGNSIYLVNNETNERYNIPFICNDNDTITMSNGVHWTYVDENTYQVEMMYFDQNCINGDKTNTPLVSIFDLHFDESVPFVKTSTDVGFAGVRMGSAHISSDIYDKYPHEINKWEGLPEWITDSDGEVPEHFVMYAFHQTPTYTPENPESMQGAGIILDPGKVMQTETLYDDEGNPIINNESIGRVYIVSNDDLEYKNNANEEYPKPARTAARICDIPTSVMQLTGTTGLSPEPIVDKKYVRTEANYSEDDKNRLYNILASRWVRPTALTKTGVPVCEEWGFNNKFAFETNVFSDGRFLNTLDYVDLVDHNDFRYTININPKVDVSKIGVAAINACGEGYYKNDMGVCVVGGYSFTYIVNEVDSTGGVTIMSLVPDDRAPLINLSNLDMMDNISGVSKPYGTSPTVNNSPDGKPGTGLKFSFYIDYDYYQSIITKKGDIFDDLFAFVRERTGLYVYQYIVNKNSLATPKDGKWVKGPCISEYEVTSVIKEQGGVSTQEAYINSILPSVRDLPVVLNDNNEDPTVLVTLQTSSFVNIIDKDKTPVQPALISDGTTTQDSRIVVDMCKFYCEGLQTVFAEEKTVNSVRDKLKDMNVLRFDSYVIWRWVDPASKTNKMFEFGIVSRSFNNLFTTDQITMLPTNKLNCDNFVHTNANTTIVWDVEGVGVMMWVYDPTYTKKEKYWIDAATRELHISRTEMSYGDIDIRKSISEDIPEIVKDGKLMFNIMTNNPICIDDTDVSPIYQQPEMTQMNDTVIGSSIDNIASNHRLCGNWKLVFPRVQSFKLKNDKTNTEWIPVKMQTIKGRSISDIGTVYDSSGSNVNAKSLIINEGTEKIEIKMFNSNTGKWEKI